jgi:hypothetical protein
MQFCESTPNRGSGGQYYARPPPREEPCIYIPKNHQSGDAKKSKKRNPV